MPEAHHLKRRFDLVRFGGKGFPIFGLQELPHLGQLVGDSLCKNVKNFPHVPRIPFVQFGQFCSVQEKCGGIVCMGCEIWKNLPKNFLELFRSKRLGQMLIHTSL